MKTKTTKAGAYLGEYGLRGGTMVYEISTVRGYTAEIRRLWRRLDKCDGLEAEEIITRLVKIGAAVCEGPQEA